MGAGGASPFRKRFLPSRAIGRRDSQQLFSKPLAAFSTAKGSPRERTQQLTRLKVQISEAEDERDEDEGALAAFGCLRALSTVLDSVSSLPHLFPALEPIVFPVLQRMSTQEGQDVFEEIMEILSYFTYFSPQVRTCRSAPRSSMHPVSQRGRERASPSPGPTSGLLVPEAGKGKGARVDSLCWVAGKTARKAGSLL